MSETEGLMAQASVEAEDNQQPEETISHIQPEAGPQSLDEVTVASEGEEVEFERPDWYPDKFWNDDDGPDLENLAKSYNELQKKFSQGKHKAPDEYDEKVFTDANIPEDDELYNSYKGWAKDNGISQDAFDQLASKFIELSAGEAEAAEVSFKEEHAKLGPNADATIKSMTDWASGLVRKGVWSEGDFEEFRIMGGTAQGLKALQKVRSYYGDRPIPVDVGPVDGAPSKEELNSMVGKPEYQTDPAYRAKVEKMFEQVYGTQDYSAI
tara:strand:+ start:3907 stop:4707 length:801 start_codon:yes stop_codon:yes gene_type:complete